MEQLGLRLWRFSSFEREVMLGGILLAESAGKYFGRISEFNFRRLLKLKYIVFSDI